METVIGDVQTLHTIIHFLKEVNQTLIDKIRNLKQNCNFSDFELSNKISQQEIDHENNFPLTKPSERWIAVNHRRSLKTRTQLVLNEVNFPALKNKYIALQQDFDRPCSERQVALFDLGLPK